MEKDWYSIKEAAEYLEISEPTLYRWMKSNKISFYKVGNSTRFSQDNLNMVASKQISETEGELAASRCAVCGNSEMVSGKMQGIGRTYFRPDKTKFLTMHEPMIQVEANMCPICGYIQLRGNTGKLGKVVPDQE